MATDEELAELFVSRNPNRVKKGIDWAPKHSQGLGEIPRRRNSHDSESDRAEKEPSRDSIVRPSPFYAKLVGKYVQSVGDESDRLLNYLGLQRFASSIDSTSIDELEMLMEAPEGMTQEEYAYLGTALISAGKEFDWAVDLTAGDA